MIQIIGLLLCVYLVFKGFEIFQIAYSVPENHRNNGAVLLGVLAIVASILLAAVFAFLLLASGMPVDGPARLPVKP
jgi:uncharacterized membrane protein